MKRPSSETGKNISSPHHEKEVLKALLSVPKLQSYVFEYIKSAEVFFDAVRKQIFLQCLKRFEDGATISLMIFAESNKIDITMERAFAEFGAGEIITTTQLYDACAVLAEKMINRKKYEECRKMIQDIEVGEINGIEIIERSEMVNEGLRDEIEHLRAEKSNEQKSQDFFSSLIRLRDKIDTPILTGILDFDKLTGGFYGGELIIIAGRPGSGKSSFAQTIMHNQSIIGNVPGALISLEMNDYQNIARFVSMKTGIPVHRLRCGDVTGDETTRIGTYLQDYFSVSNLHIIAKGSMTHHDFQAKVRNLYKKHKIRYVFVDYIQLMTGSGLKNSNRDNEMGLISRAMKRIALELNIPVIALAQLNRNSEALANKKPQLSHLRESGNLEQDADSVNLIHRPELYGIKEIELYDGTMIPSAGVAEIIHAKSRQGEVRALLTQFDGASTMFRNLELRRTEIMSSPYQSRYEIENDTSPF